MPDRTIKSARHVAAIVLAAGHSARMGGNDKLLLEIDGESMVHRAARTALDADLDVIVVAAAGNAAVIQALDGLQVRIIENRHSDEGMASSIRAGVDAIAQSHAAALIMLADMPLLAPPLLAALCDAFAAHDANAIVAPRFRGHRGNPVLWGSAYFDALKNLTGDNGARHLLDQHAPCLRCIESPDDSVLIDIDTPADHRRLQMAARRKRAAGNK